MVAKTPPGALSYLRPKAFNPKNCTRVQRLNMNGQLDVTIQPAAEQRSELSQGEALRALGTGSPDLASREAATASS
jgi:hypothetical protein